MPGLGFLHHEGERRGGGFDGGVQFRKHGDDAAKHGRGEENGENGGLAHDRIPFEIEKVVSKILYSIIGCSGGMIS